MMTLVTWKTDLNTFTFNSRNFVIRSVHFERKSEPILGKNLEFEAYTQVELYVIDPADGLESFVGYVRGAELCKGVKPGEVQNLNTPAARAAADLLVHLESARWA